MLRNRIASAAMARLAETRGFAFQIDALASEKKLEEIKKHFGRTKLEQQLLGFSTEEIAKMPKFVSRATQKLEYLEKSHRHLVNFSNEMTMIEKHKDVIKNNKSMIHLTKHVYIPLLQSKFTANNLYSNRKVETFGAPGRMNKQIREGLPYLKKGSPFFLNPRSQVAKEVDLSDPTRSKKEFIIGIESSFDEASACIINSFGVNTFKSYTQAIHSPSENFNGGVNPTEAVEHHKRWLPKAIGEVLQSKKNYKLKAIAVTQGPGQIDQINVGLQEALKIGRRLNIPVIPINHLEAHLMTGRFGSVTPVQKTGFPQLQFPYVSVLLTGKHSQIVYTQGVGEHKILGTVFDQAIGTAFDRFAAEASRYISKQLINGDHDAIEFVRKHQKNESTEVDENVVFDQAQFFHGGRLIQELALAHLKLTGGKFDEDKFKFSKAMQSRNTCDMSFSSYYSAARLHAMSYGDISFKDLVHLCYSFEQALSEMVNRSTRRALINLMHHHNLPITALNFCGGVACNQTIKKGLISVGNEFQLRTRISKMIFNTDNAAMIGWMGWETLNSGLPYMDLRNLEPKEVVPLESLPLGTYNELPVWGKVKKKF